MSAVPVADRLTEVLAQIRLESSRANLAAGQGRAWHGVVRLGPARPGPVGLGGARRGKARQAR